MTNKQTEKAWIDIDEQLPPIGKLVITKQKDYEKEHSILKSSGMFWEFYPELSGEWEKDKEAFIAFRKRCERKYKLKNK